MADTFRDWRPGDSAAGWKDWMASLSQHSARGHGEENAIRGAKEENERQRECEREIAILTFFYWRLSAEREGCGMESLPPSLRVLFDHGDR